MADLRLDIAGQRHERLYDGVLVAGHGPVHGLDLHLEGEDRREGGKRGIRDLGVGLDLGGDVVLAANVLGLVVLEGLLPLGLVVLDLGLRLLLGLLQPPVLPLPGLAHLHIGVLPR